MSDPITTPSAQNPFFLYDPDACYEWTYYPTEKERDEAAKEAIEDCLDDGDWMVDSVEGIMTGVITHTTQKTDPEYDPERNEETYNYILQPLNPTA